MPGTSSLNADEQRRRDGIHPRYAREWLEQQAVAEILEHDDGRFLLPDGHAEALVDRDSLAYAAPLARAAVALGRPLPLLLDAFRRGDGVPRTAYGEDGREAQADINRVQFLHRLGSEWLPARPDVHARLQEPGARIADLACGAGWSCIAMARAYPDAVVDGFDLDEASVALARESAAVEGVGDRVRFQACDVSAGDAPGRYDLVTVFEALHDMARPVEALAGMRRLAEPGGTVLVAGERTNDELTVGDPHEQYLYDCSVLCCLPTAMGEEGSAATGTVMRRTTFEGYARTAGFAGVEVLPIEHDDFRFYRLR